MVASGFTRQDYQGNLGGDLVGGQDKANKEGHLVVGESVVIKGRQVESWRCGDGYGQCLGGRRNLCGGGGGHDRLGLGAGAEMRARE